MDIDDAALVRAPRWLAYQRLIDLGSWGTWWPGLEVVNPPGLEVMSSPVIASSRVRTFHLQLSVARRWPGQRLLRVAVIPTRWRVDTGLAMTVVGDITGRAEFWLEAVGDGTLVHHVARLEPTRLRSVPALWRMAVRQGLWGLADTLASEVREMVGVTP